MLFDEFGQIFVMFCSWRGCLLGPAKSQSHTYTLTGLVFLYSSCLFDYVQILIKWNKNRSCHDSPYPIDDQWKVNSGLVHGTWWLTSLTRSKLAGAGWSRTSMSSQKFQIQVFWLEVNFIGWIWSLKNKKTPDDDSIFIRLIKNGIEWKEGL